MNTGEFLELTQFFISLPILSLSLLYTFHELQANIYSKKILIRYYTLIFLHFDKRLDLGAPPTGTLDSLVHQ